MKLKYPTLRLKYNLLILLFVIFYFQNLTAQITPFEMVITPTEEVCKGSGVLTIDITGTQNDTEFEFVIYQLPDTTTPFRVTNGIKPNEPDFTVLQHIENSFPSGNYRVVATQTLDAQTNQVTQDATIDNNKQDLFFTATERTICGGAEITANVTTGNAITYEIRDTSNVVILPPQASNILTPVPPGDYIVVVKDDCDDEFTQGITIANQTVDYTFKRSIWNSNDTSVFRVLENCNNYNHTEELRFNGNSTLPNYVFPLDVVMTVENPENPGLPTVISDTWTSNAQNDSAYSIPFYSGESYDYTIEITDACGNNQIRNEIIDAESRVNFREQSTLLCGQEYISMNLFEGWIAPLDLTFITYPAGFDPHNYRSSEYAPGAYTANYTSVPGYLNMGDSSNPLPNGTYTLEVSDSCGSTFTETLTIGSTVDLVITKQRLYGGCDADEGSLMLFLRNRNASWTQAANITTMTITSAPSAYPNSLPDDVTANVTSNGRFTMSSLPAGNYTFEAQNDCGTTITETFTVPSGRFTSSVTPEINCGSFNVAASLESSLGLEQLWLQKYFPDSDQWGHPETDALHTTGTELTSTNAMTIGWSDGEDDGLRTMNRVLNNVLSDGLMRVIVQSGIYRNGETNTSLDCRITLDTFTVPVSRVTIDDYYLGTCSNGNSELVLQASGIAPLNYSIIEFNGKSITPIDNGDNPVFSDLTQGEYTVQVEDACFNLINIKLNTGLAVPPRIISSGLCDGENGYLFVQGISFLDIEWTKDADPSILGTGNTLNFTPYNELSDGGTYYAKLSYPSNPSACANQTLSFTTIPSAFPNDPEIEISCNGIGGGGNTFNLEITLPIGSEYEYNLNNGTYQSSNEFSINSGTYTLHVRNTNTGCEKIYVDSPIVLENLKTSALIKDVRCKSENSGEIDITVTGGTSPYSFQWNNTATSEDLTDLIVGSYTVVVTDANGCEISLTYEVQNGPEAELDTDSDGIYNPCDLDDDNDGILDIDECPVIPGAALPQSDAFSWVSGGYNIFVIGGNTNALGYQESGFEQYAYQNSKELIVLNSTSDFSFTGNTGQGSSLTSIATFNNGTVSYTHNLLTNNFAELRGATSNNSTSGDIAHGIYVRPENGLNVGDQYTATINFTTPVTAFSFDWVDIFDTFTEENPILRYEVIIEGNLLAYVTGPTSGDDSTGNLSLYDGNNNFIGTILAGQNIEDTFGFVSESPISKMSLVYKVVSGSIRDGSIDHHGIDNFVYSSGVCDTDGDSTNNHLDLDSDNDGCNDADEAYNNTDADGGDSGIYGTDSPTLSNGGVNSNGLVIIAGIDGSGESYTNTISQTTNGKHTFQEAIQVSVTEEVEDETACINGNVTFKSTATATILPTTPVTTASTDITYQWLVSTDNGTNFNNISGETGTVSSGTEVTLTINSVTDTDDGNIYKVFFTNEANTCGAESEGVLNVPNELTLSITNVTNIICNQSTGSIVVSASGGTSSYSYSKDGGTNYQNTGEFNDLSEGNYTITVLDQNNCTANIPVKINNSCITLVKSGVFNDENNDNCTDVNETITYTFTVTNTGNASVQNLALTDPLLEAPNPLVAILLASGDTDNDNELDPTETWIYAADYAVKQADIDVAQVSNQANITALTLDNNSISDTSGTTTTTDDATVTTLCQGESTIALVKTAVFNDENNDNCTDVDETISYTFTLTNTGNVSVDAIVLNDPLLLAPNPVVAIVLTSGNTDNDNELDPTETWIYTADYAVTQTDIDAAQVSNQATVNGENVLTNATVSDTSGTIATTDDATVTTLCQGESTIALVKTAVFNDENNDNCTDVDETISYTFTLTNTGNVSVDAIVLSDPLLETPNPVVAIVLTSGDTDNDNELDPTETWIYTADYAVTQTDIDAAQVSNQATVNGENVLTNATVSDTSGTTATTDDATVTTLCQGESTIALVKTAVFNDENNDNCTDVDETISYTFTLTNTGNVSVDAIVLSDPLLETPNPVVAIVLTSGDTDNDNELDPTETWIYTADYAVTQTDIDAAQVSNQATVNGENVLTNATVSDTSGTIATTDDATVTTLCQGESTIALVKTAVFNDENNDNCTDVDETISYTFTLTNTGNVSVDNIVLNDPLLLAPNPVVAIVLTSGDTDNDNELDPTETWIYTADYAVTQTDIDAAQVSNQATVNGENVLTNATVSDTSGTTATTDDATVTTLCQGESTIALVKTAVFNDENNDNCTDVDETISYTFTLTNTGNVSVDNIVLNDPLLLAPNPVVATVLTSGDTDNDNELDPTETWIYTADYAVTQTDIDAAQVSNQATVNGENVLTNATVSDTSGTTATTDDATVTTLCQGESTIALVKTAVFNDENNDNCTDVDETISYTFTLTNTGNVSVDAIVLSDPLLETPNPVVAIVLTSGDTDNDNELDPTETWIYTADYAVTQTDIDAAQVSNQATVNGENVLTNATVSDTSGTTATTDDATVTTLCQGESTIALVKTAVFNDENNDNCTDVDETISYTFTLTNTGNVSVDAIVLSDPLLETPNPVVAIVLTSGDTDNDNELDPTETWIYTADYAVTQTDIDAAQVSNQATVNGENVLTNATVSDTSGTTATTDDATVTTLCQGESTIALVKTAVFNDENNDNCTDVDETISYTFTLTNTGNVSVDAIVLSDPLLETPNPVVAIVLTSGDTDNDNELDPTETWIYTADYAVTQTDIDAAQVSNQATVNGENVLTNATVSDTSGTIATTDDATVTTLCQGESTIALVKTAVFNDENNDNCTDVDETISYTFTLTNTGNVSVDAIVLSDPLLEAPNPVVAIVLTSGDTDNDNELDPTETWIYTADYAVTQTDIDAAQVSNQATVNGENVLTNATVSDTSGTTATTDDATVTTLCQGESTIALVKTAVFNDENNDNCTDVDETISYTFTLTNTGNVSVDAIVLSDPLLETPNPVVAIVLTSGDTDNDNELDPTETWIYTADYAVTQTDIDAAQVSNQATVNGENVLTNATVSDTSGTIATTDDATVTTLCQGESTIALVKTAVFNDENNDNCTDVDETISYTFTLTNTGNVSVDAIVLSDPLLETPNPVVAIVLTSGDTDNDNELDPTETWIYTADYAVTQTDIDAAQVSNQATVNGENVLTNATVSDTSGTIATTDDATVTTLCQGESTIALVKTAVFNDENNDNCTDVDETISYTFTLTNTGNVSVDNIVLNDPLLLAPNPVVAIVLTSGDTDNDNELDPTETWIYTADYAVTQTDIDAAQVSNQATVNGENVLTNATVSDTSGTTATTDDATVTTLCQGKSTIALVKTAVFNDENNDNCTDVDETISYTFTLTNTGNVSVDNIVLNDPLLLAPNPVVAIVLTSGDTDNDNELDPTETWIYTADYAVTQTDIDAAQVSNQATVNGENVLTNATVSDTSGTTATTDDATVTTLCQGESTIALVKTAVFNDENNDNCTDVDETISYTFTLTNTGNVSVDAIVLSDPLLETPNPVVAIVLTSGDTDNDNELDPTETWIYTADYAVTQTDIDAAQVSNQATVNGENVLTNATVSDTSGTTATTDDATVTTLCQGESTIALVKTAVFNDENNDNCTDVDETISYTFTLTNTGNVSVDAIVLSDPLLETPNPVVAIVLTSGDTDNDNELDPTETWIYTADYAVTQTDIDAAQVSNQATVNGENVLTNATVSDTSGTIATTDDATVTTLCQGESTIALVKTAVFNDENNDNCTDVDETISYTFTLTNTGNVSVDAIVLSDPLLETPNPVVAIVLTSGDTDNDNELDPTETWIYTADYAVTQTDIDAAQVSNQATVNGENVLTNATVSDTSGTIATTDDATVTTLCQGESTIALVKTAVFNDENNDNCTDVDETISYTFTLTNTGNVSVDAIVLSDPLLEAPNPVVAIVLTSGDTDNDNELDPTETWIYTADYAVTQTDIDAAQVSNQATVNGENVLTNATVSDTSGTTATTDDATVTTLCQGESTIALVKTAVFNDENNDNCTDVDETISYTFTLTNTGNVSVDAIVLSDPLLETPNPVVAIVLTSGDTDNDNELDPTETWIYTADYAVTQTDIDAAQVSNQATVNGENVLTNATVSDTSGTIATTDDATVTTLCQGESTIALVKTAVFNDENNDNCTDVDETISYTFTLTNTGNVSVDAIVLSDPLLETPNPVVAIVLTSGDTDNDNELDPTETWIYTADYAVTQTDIDAAQVSNQATVNGENVLTNATVSDTSGTIATTDDATVTTLCQGESTIALVKTAVFNDENNDNCTDVDETISYTFTLTNTGNVSVDNIVLNDPLLLAPNPVVAIVLTSGDTDNDNELDPTETWIYTADYAVTQTDIDAAQVSNQATVNGENVLTNATVSDTSGTTATTDDATVTTLCQGESTIALVKTAVFNDENNDNCTDVDETISYTFTLTNTGNVSVDNIVLNDPLLLAPNPVVAIVLTSGDTDNDNELDPTERWIYTADYAVTQTDIDAAQVSNQATVNGENVLTNATVSDTSGTTATTDDATVTTLCQGESTIALVKTAVFNDENNDNCTDVDETISYTFTLTNTGNVSMDAIVLSDPLLETPNPVVAIVLASGDTDNDNELDPTETWIYTADYAVTQTDIDAAQVSNQATVNGENVLTNATVSDTSGTTATTDDATVTTLCQGESTIALVKTAVFNDENNDNCTDVDETISYTFTLTNTGNVSMDAIVLSDPLLETPNPVVAIVLTSGDTDNDNELDPTETWIYTADYAVTQTDIDAAQVSNQATVNGENVLTNATVSDTSGTTATTDDATVTKLCQGESTINIVKSAIIANGETCLIVGSELAYSFTLTNLGNVSINTLTITDTLLGGDITADLALAGDLNTNGVLEPTETWIYTANNYTVTQTDVDNGIITNTVTVNGLDTNNTNITATDTYVIDENNTEVEFCNPTNGLNIVKSAAIANGETCLIAGSEVTYTFTVTNTGTISINTVTITDTLLGGDITTDLALAGDLNTNGVLEPTETWIYTTNNYTVTQTDVDNGIITNTATVDGIEILGSTNVTATDTYVIDENNTSILFCPSNPRIDIVKTGVFNNDNNNSCTEIDETITYTFSVSNTGNISLENVTIADPLLENATPAVLITYVSGDEDADQKLDLTETWVYTATYLVTQIDIDATEVINTATVTAEGVVKGTIVTGTSQTTTELIKDTTPPDTSSCTVLDETKECGGTDNENIAIAWNVANIESLKNCATDACGNNFTVTSDFNFTNLVSTCGAAGTITVTYTLSDTTGNASTHTATLTIEDTSAPEPTTTIKTSIAVNCESIPDVPKIEFIDGCSENVDVVFDETNSFDESDPSDYEVIRTWTVTDDCNNSKNFTQTITVTLNEFISSVSERACNNDGTINLDDFLQSNQIGGNWIVIEGGARIDDNIFDPEDVVLGIYKFSYTISENDCLSTTEVSIEIHDDCIVLPCGKEDVIISKVVTPNGDMHNEFFTITGVEICDFTVELQIFNRWGAKIYDNSNYKNDWNGFAHNSSVGRADKVPNGTYYYVINLKNSGLKPFAKAFYVGTK